MVEARTTDKMSQGTADAGRTLSVIIPVYNEEAVLETLFQRLEDIAANLDMAVEFLFVNDGSRDCSMELLLDFHHRDVRCKIVEFSRNFGHQAALSAGLAEATGDCAVLIDADLQDPPELITELLEKWRSGYDVVYAIRRNRKENFLKRMAYAGFYRLFALLADIEMPLDSGDFCLLDRAVIDQLNAMPERGRFLRGLRTWVGYRQIGVPYERDARLAGKSKYSYRMLFALASDGIFTFSSVPLRLASYLGALVGVAAVAILGWALLQKLRGDELPAGWASLMCVVLGLSSIQLFGLGILGQYVGAIHMEVKRRPAYVMRRRIGFPERAVRDRCDLQASFSR